MDSRTACGDIRVHLGSNSYTWLQRGVHTSLHYKWTNCLDLSFVLLRKAKGWRLHFVSSHRQTKSIWMK